MSIEGRWNHNIHYHPVVLRRVPADARTALDVGTGDGILAAELSRRVPLVVAIDRDEAVLDRARQSIPGVEFVHGDVMEHTPPEGPFDLVASVATLHHLPDLDAGLARLASLTAPGGVLVVVGLARSSRPADFAMDCAGFVQHRFLSRARGHWEHTAPVSMDVAHIYRQVRATAETVLPGVRWRRLPLFRYSLVWHRAPARDGTNSTP